MARGVDLPASNRLVVLHSAHDRLVQANPFVAMTLACVPAGMRARAFTWRAALFGRYHVFHLHWPEHLMTSARRPTACVKTVLTVLLLARLSLGNIPVVWTVHNERPHQRESSLHRLIRERFERRAACRIVMSRCSLPAAGSRARLIRHGHYRDWLAPHRPAPPEAGRIVHFGFIKEYKGIPALLTAFAGVDDDNLRLELVGQPASSRIAHRIRSLSATDDRVVVSLGYRSDPDLVRSVTAAEAVVLPYVDMSNSGALLFALSLDRPVIVPRTPANSEISDEVGPGWVVQYDPPLSPDKLLGALTVLRGNVPNGRPGLDGREWKDVGRRLFQCYRDVVVQR